VQQQHKITVRSVRVRLEILDRHVEACAMLNFSISYCSIFLSAAVLSETSKLSLLIFISRSFIS
jgi:hypothetical protein